MTGMVVIRVSDALLLAVHHIASVQALLGVLSSCEHRMLIGHHQGLLRVVVIRV